MSETVGLPAQANPWLRRLSFSNMSAIYIGVALFVLFAIWIPNSFLQPGVWRTLLDSLSVTAILAMALVVPVAAGAFNLAIGTELGLGAILVAFLLTGAHLPVALAIALSLAVSVVVGLTTGMLITGLRVDPFIASLGVSSVLLAVISWISRDQQILGLSPEFARLGGTPILGQTSAVWIMLVLGVALWYLLEQTQFGRRVYAVGGNIEAARLAGVPTGRVIVASLAVCGLIAGFAGVLLSSKLSTGDPTAGPPYLLPAFTAVFLGSTQFRNGRFNIPGTLVSAFVLAMGVKGFQLAGAPVWIPDLFNGVALILAVALAAQRGRTGQPERLRRILKGMRGGRTRAVAAESVSRPG